METSTLNIFNIHKNNTKNVNAIFVKTYKNQVNHVYNNRKQNIIKSLFGENWNNFNVKPLWFHPAEKCNKNICSYGRTQHSIFASCSIHQQFMQNVSSTRCLGLSKCRVRTSISIAVVGRWSPEGRYCQLAASVLSHVVTCKNLITLGTATSNGSARELPTSAARVAATISNFDKENTAPQFGPLRIR